ncbi:UNVERIFIED_CONTAM: hypothetical protein PYX00_009500 [Menopon gallinae]|uniref:Uncharacterized protein n=1 Tax=Menopon gallinae TaxID=328185 RepID=A0AAW2HBJ8_9NEOP
MREDSRPGTTTTPPPPPRITCRMSHTSSSHFKWESNHERLRHAGDMDHEMRIQVRIYFSAAEVTRRGSNNKERKKSRSLEYGAFLALWR